MLAQLLHGHRIDVTVYLVVFYYFLEQLMPNASMNVDISHIIIQKIHLCSCLHGL